MLELKRTIAALLALTACSPPAHHTAENVTTTTTTAAPPPAPRPPVPVPTDDWPPAPGTAGGLPDDRTPLSEGKIDPKSAQGAAQVVQLYGIYLHERKFAEAYALWGSDGAASGMSQVQFAAAFAKYAEINALVGGPGATDGAAGSIYVTIPLQLYGTLAATGKRFNLIGPVTLRRVNDVDGATAAQLRWHITDSSLKPTL